MLENRKKSKIPQQQEIIEKADFFTSNAQVKKGNRVNTQGEKRRIDCEIKATRQNPFDKLNSIIFPSQEIPKEIF